MDNVLRSYGQKIDTKPDGMLARVDFPVLAWLDEWTTDGRWISGEGFSPRDLPLPVMMKTHTSQQHDGAVIAGRIDSVDIAQNEAGRAYATGTGWALDDENGQNLVRLRKAGALRGNSVDLSVADEDVEVIFDDERGDLAGMFPKAKFNKSKMTATTIVPVPAFEGATFDIPDEDSLGLPDPPPLLVAAVEGDMSPVMQVTFSSGSATAVRPRVTDFANPQLREPTPITVTADGKVFGHIAAWNSRHLSAPGGPPPPRSKSAYAYFATGSVLCDGGESVRTGRLVIGGDHAAGDLGLSATLDHYADVSRAWADVAIGEDAIGIWVSGIVRPGIPDEMVHAARASALSGDWRLLGGALELVAVLSVNTPAFPIQAAGFTERGITLSATGLGALAPATAPAPVSQDVVYLANRMRALEAKDLSAAFGEA